MSLACRRERLHISVLCAVLVNGLSLQGQEGIGHMICYCAHFDGTHDKTVSVHLLSSREQ